MGRFRSRGLRLIAAIISLWGLAGCGGHRPPGSNPNPAKITLSPAGSTTVQQGNALTFIASAQNTSAQNVTATFTFTSSDTSILNIAPNGIACAGRWDAAFTTCTPGGAGAVQVTASALGATSIPTLVFVHPPIDNIIVKGVLLGGIPIQEPCLSQSQSMTVEAHAFSQGTDITSSVGPFTWTANNSGVVKLSPIVNPAYNVATNQATATAVTPGITQIFASASSVSSNSFTQPQLFDQAQNPLPVFNFFETCPIQSIKLEVGSAGSQRSDFSVSKGTAQTVTATLTDVMGNSSLPNTNGAIVLSKIPLIWTSTQPTVVGVGTGCTQSCALTTPAPGGAAVAASCSPPSCNIGFPLSPAVLSSAQCAQYFPPSCRKFIPLPVYAESSISGLVTGATSAGAALASSLDCAKEPPAECTTALYSVSVGKGQTGSPSGMPTSPNSILFDLAGDKAYMGSDFGAQLINPANVGTSNGAFSGLSTVTGKVLAISTNGGVAVFSDTIHTPNQVYIVNTTGTSVSSVTALNISQATTAAFSPDGLKSFIFGYDSNNQPKLYVYSALQALQAIALPSQTTVSSIVFSNNGALAYVVEPSSGGAGPAVALFNTCCNHPVASFNLSAPPVAFRALPDGLHFVALNGGGSIDYIAGTTVHTINLGQGTINPITFFTSGDGTLLYVVASDRSSILVYNFNTGAVTGIELVGNATPIAADMSPDAGTILVAASDGMIHEVATALGGSDMLQVGFTNLPNEINPFCTSTPATGACKFDFLAVRP